VCLDHLGNVYSKMGRAAKAVYYYLQSLKVRRLVRERVCVCARVRERDRESVCV
jgi:hypothetical protein